MSVTKSILNSVLARLQQALPDYAVELFPDNSEQYHFEHPLGAVLIGYQSSKFRRSRDIELMAQKRRIVLNFTVFGRGLNADGASLDLLDALRVALAGFCPAHCKRIRLLNECFLSESAGVWKYKLRARTETMQVENRAATVSPTLTQVCYRQPGQPLNPNLNPNPNFKE